MKKIIPLKKQINFKTNISEITSISLENTLYSKNKSVEGELIISGTYKITETSQKVDEFEYKIPVTIEIDDKYITDNIKIDINDFYYEILNNDILDVNIEILIDNIIEKPEINIEEEKTDREENIMEPEKNNTLVNEKTDKRCIEETEEPEEKENIAKQDVKNIIENMTDDNEEYSTYHIYIVREGDTVETILSKYNITKEQLNEYNNTSELKIGDKIIIPES